MNNRQPPIIEADYEVISDVRLIDPRALRGDRWDTEFHDQEQRRRDKIVSRWIHLLFVWGPIIALIDRFYLVKQ